MFKVKSTHLSFLAALSLLVFTAPASAQVFSALSQPRVNANLSGAVGEVFAPPGVATRKDGTFWMVSVTTTRATPAVGMVISSSIDSQGRPVMGNSTVLPIATFPALLGSSADGNSDGLQGFNIYSYLSSTPTGDRNVVYAYMGTDNALHYGQWRATTTAFSKNSIAGPQGQVFTQNSGGTKKIARVAIATSGPYSGVDACSLLTNPNDGSTAVTVGTCLYFFVQDIHGFIYYKWVACPANGSCSTFSTNQAVNTGAPDYKRWNRISNSGRTTFGDLAAASVGANKVMLIAGTGTGAGGTTNGKIISYNVVPKTGAVSGPIGWGFIPDYEPPFIPGQAYGITTDNRGSGCATVLGLKADPDPTSIKKWQFAFKTCDGVNQATSTQPWIQDAKWSSIVERVPGGAPVFVVGSGTDGNDTTGSEFVQSAQ